MLKNERYRLIDILKMIGHNKVSRNFVYLPDMWSAVEEVH